MTEEAGFASIRLASADDCGTVAFTLRPENVESPRTDTYQVPAAEALKEQDSALPPRYGRRS
ncbi:hypothetical protein OV208_24745 [Corallococcus sp. bb12-1]|uniref:hypothetical protein n=1 Tax=Corallococcus sp. bb12-1 TaxID=2996784 RepID=UPI00226D948F|nr:hypothetical protein [Corallococcus sp. bb12-1]MCY1044550.1 hypothetical protein [Corallococcus sp. bb12-1]